MAYDAMAGYIYELNTDALAENVPDQYKAFLEVLERFEVTTDMFGLALDCDDWSMLGIGHEQSEELLQNAYDDVKLIFKMRTGLEVSLSSIDSGSVHNEVTGPVWCVINATQPTPEAAAMDHYIQQKFFCHFG